MTESHDEVLAELAEEVRQGPPRMFAIYGVYDGPPLENDENSGYVEWGLEFTEEPMAIAWSPGSTTISASAERMLECNAKLGAARLVWFP